MASNYRIERAVDSLLWDQFIHGTDYATIFQYGAYLDAVQVRHSRYFVYNKQELRAAFVIIESPDGENSVLDDFVIYNGIAFGRSTTGQNHAQRMSEHFRITECVAETLPTVYKKIEMALAPSAIDIRPFLWVNYGTDAPKYKADIRYTSILDISDFSKSNKLDNITTYSRAANARRQVIRYARRDEVRTAEEFDADAFVALYSSTMERQDIDVAQKKINRMRSLIVSLKGNGYLRMFVSRTKDGQIGSMACFAIDHQRAYYLLGANEPKFRDYHTGTAVLWDAFYALNDDGINEVDLEGVNSPKRGWFKLSFGGELLPYYEMQYQG